MNAGISAAMAASSAARSSAVWFGWLGTLILPQ